MFTEILSFKKEVDRDRRRCSKYASYTFMARHTLFPTVHTYPNPTLTLTHMHWGRIKLKEEGRDGRRKRAKYRKKEREGEGENALM